MTQAILAKEVAITRLFSKIFALFLKIDDFCIGNCQIPTLLQTKYVADNRCQANYINNIGFQL